MLSAGTAESFVMYYTILYIYTFFIHVMVISNYCFHDECFLDMIYYHIFKTWHEVSL